VFPCRRNNYVSSGKVVAVAKKFGQKITHFYCRKCADYHVKTHPHYRAQRRRARAKKVAG
jgi:hypothetical protein